MTDPVTRLNAALEGRYSIERELGEGGMATVYLARDLKHNRNVALKVLKPELAAVVGAERFLVEIETTANLQHPHILPLFDSGHADSFLFYVMPYVEGDTLRDRIDREKQLSIEESLRIIEKVASALEHAHKQGVVHRDIKPGNILLSSDGEPTVADFGIALAVAQAGGGRVTETGLSVGTPHYMSPEQATGDRDVDPRTDVYALGCVLYEMLIGEPPYTGSTAQAILGKIIQGSAISATDARSTVPPNVDAAIRKALEKLPADRFMTAQEFAKALGDSGFRHGEMAGSGAGDSAGTWKRLAMGFAGLLGVMTVALAVVLLRSDPPAVPGAMAAFPTPFLDSQLPTGRMRFTADGSALIYVGEAASGSGSQLWIRRWDDLVATPIRGTEAGPGVVLTFTLSPDESEIAFTELDAQTPLRAVPVGGGPARTMVENVTSIFDWGSDGNVYVTFGVSPAARMGRARADGTSIDSIEPLADLADGESIHSSFRLLPGGNNAVFQVWHAPSGIDAELWILDLEALERRFLAPGLNPWYTGTGHLLYGTPEGTLMAAPMDPVEGVLTGPSVPLVEGLSVRPPFGTMDYALSESGTLLYAVGAAASGTGGEGELVWVDRSGNATPVDRGWSYDPGRGDGYGWALSPEGDRIATSRQDAGEFDIWIKQLSGGPFDRLTLSEEQERFPTWTPDGEFVTYSRGQGGEGDFGLWQRRADGTGEPIPLLEQDDDFMGQSVWSPDGQWLVFMQADPLFANGGDIFGFRPGIDAGGVPLVANPSFSEVQPAISPDGRWLAYVSDESGQNEVYVRPFPDTESGRLRVSTEGGRAPLWSRDGREIFYVDAGNNLAVADVEGTSVLGVAGRRILFPIGIEYGIEVQSDFIDISLDSQRFLMGRIAGSGGVEDGEGPRFVLVQNFSERLREIVRN